ncbi:hypothetical protein [Fodinicurvata sp. EGI_FJ10296]|uniref:hypothetical protein n=1 Tax=Fodinicurvata sp. EGI_FJ10296 TaxID=3231908 RepID=UPI003451FAD2
MRAGHLWRMVGSDGINSADDPQTIRHIDHERHTSLEPVIGFQEPCFFRQIDIDRPRHALEQKRRMRCRIEIAVEIRGVVQHLDIALLGRPPTNMGQQA